MYFYYKNCDPRILYIKQINYLFLFQLLQRIMKINLNSKGDINLIVIFLYAKLFDFYLRIYFNLFDWNQISKSDSGLVRNPRSVNLARTWKTFYINQIQVHGYHHKLNLSSIKWHKWVVYNSLEFVYVFIK